MEENANIAADEEKTQMILIILLGAQEEREVLGITSSEQIFFCARNLLYYSPIQPPPL